MKKLLARIPWFNKKSASDTLGGVYLASDKVVAVLLCRVDNSWQVERTIVESFQHETNKLAAIEKAVEQLPHGCEVSLILSEQAYQWVQIEKPNLVAQEILTSLPWTIKDLVSLDPSDIIADYYESPLKQGGQEKINVVVTSRTLLTPVLKVFQNSSVMLNTISTPEMAFCDMVICDGGAHMLVTQQFGTEPSLHIIRDGILLLSRRLRGLMPLAEQPLVQLKEGLLDSFGLELQRSLDYFESQLKQPPIKSLQLAIPNLELNGIANELSQFFPAKVLPFSPSLPLCEQQNGEMQFAISAALSLVERGENENSD